MVNDPRKALGWIASSGVCAILDDGLASPSQLVNMCRRLVRAGVRAFQLRAKKLPDAAVLDLATRIRYVSRGCAFFVNDRCDLAAAAGADGVHLGQEDVPISIARRFMGANAIIGVSAGSRVEVVRSIPGRPDYVSIGPAYRTATKGDAGQPLGLRRFGVLAGMLPRGKPVLAVGGITPDNVSSLVRSGADAVAVASCWWRSRDPGRTARILVTAIARARGQMRR